MVTAPAASRLASLDDETFIEEVPVDQMFTAPYCRPVGATQLGRMLKSGFDRRKLGLLTLSLRSNGRYAVLDGNHRRHLLQHFGIQSVPCRVFIDLTYEEEAALFVALNTIKMPTALDRFKARCEAGEHQALFIRDALAGLGLVLRKDVRNVKNATSCIGSYDRLYEERGEQEFTEVLSVINAAWGVDDPNAWSGRMVDAMRLFWQRYRDVVLFKDLVGRLSAKNPRRLTAIGDNSALSESPASLVGREIVAIYNVRRTKGRLPEWVAPTKTQAKTLGRPDQEVHVHTVGRRVLSRIDVARGKR